MVPATCVPWPWQSLLPLPSLMLEKPVATRPVRSLWVARTPVSITYAVTPAPDCVREYRVSSGNAR
jgi:hypothetical protein